MSRWFPGERISKIHGQAKRVEGRLIVPMYHPAAALHQAALRGAIEDDFKKLPKWLEEANRDREAADKADEPSPSQMTLF
jgi:DNA polymerase